ncbi:MAG: hypothetical protein ACOCOK_05740 [Prevotella sp.]
MLQFRRSLSRMLLSMLLLMLPLMASAQSSFIMQEECKEENCIGDLDGNGGVLILSKISDLVIIANERNDAIVSTEGKRDDGLYVYEVVVPTTPAKEVKLEVSKRGDIDRTSFTVALKPDFFYAYTIDEVNKPIRMVNQTQATDLITDEDLCEVEITSSISDLQIECPAGLLAQTSKKSKKDDASITITNIIFPIRTLQNLKKTIERNQHRLDSVNRIITEQLNRKTMSDEEIEDLIAKQEQFSDDLSEAQTQFSDLTHIDLFAEGTNRLSIDISEAGPRKKFCWGVLLREVRIPVTEFDAKIQEAARLYGLRDYKGARANFLAALDMPDVREDLVPTIQQNIADCDSAAFYHNLTGKALSVFKNAKNQQEMIDYGNAAMEFLFICNRYNPCSFYESRIKKIEETIENAPLEIRFTIVERFADYAGMVERDAMPDVEIWGDNSISPIKVKNYSESSFRKMTAAEPWRFKLLGTTDDNGVADMKLSRKDMPKAFIVYARGNRKADFKYMTLKEFMSKSTGSYVKRQLRLGLLIKR